MTAPERHEKIFNIISYQKIQSKTTMRYHITVTRIIKKINSKILVRIWSHCNSPGLLAGGNAKEMQPFLKYFH